MPKFLNHLDLNGNQLKNTKLEITDSPLGEEGVLHFHDTNKTVRYHNGTGFVTLGDSDVVSTAAAGLAPTLPNAHGGKFLKADGTYEVPAYVANSTLTTEQVQDIVGGMLVGTETRIGVGYDDAQGRINFVVDDMTANTQLDNAGVIGKVLTGLSTSTGGALAATDTLIAGFGKLEKRVALNDAKVTNVNTNTLTTFTLKDSASGSQTIAHSKHLKFVTATGALGTALTGAGTSGDPFLVTLTSPNTQIANTDVDVSLANLKTKLAGGFGSNAVTIGDSDDIVTIGNKLIVTGDLQVDGTTTTLNTATLDVEDLNITVAKGAADAAAANGAGITVDGASASLLYRNTNDNFIFNKRLDATSFHGPLTGNVTGNADTVTTNANLTGHITSSGNAAVLGSFSVAQLNTAISDASISGNNSGDGTYGISDTNFVKIDSSSVADNEFARFTANGLESRSASEVLSDIGAQASGTFVTANNAITAATKAKITFDAKGLVTSGADLASGDIPNNAADTSGSSGSCSGNAATATVVAAGGVGAVKVFELTHGVGGVTGTTNNSTNSLTWTITHAMGASFFYKVEVLLDSGTYDTVYVDVTRPTNATVKIDFGTAVANGAYRAMLTRMA